jgi:ribosomal-protein-alanine N-acetyltransferase
MRSWPPPQEPPPPIAPPERALLTARLRLRPFEFADADAIWPVVSDPSFPRHMLWAAHRSIDETRAWIASGRAAWDAGTGSTWAVTPIEQPAEVIGCVGLHGIEYQSLACRVDSAELGYWMAPHRWRQGLMTEAAAAAVAYGFGPLRLHRITSGHMTDNPASGRILEKLGFGRLYVRVADVWRDGRWHDQQRVELLRPQQAP